MTPPTDGDRRGPAALVEGLAAEIGLPGAVVAVVRPGRPLQTTCTGWADVASQRPVEAGTAFRIGSITKTMTTLLVLQLVEAGRVSLDEPVAALVDVTIRQPVDARPITIRDLMTHRSGLGELATWSALRSPLHAVGGASAAGAVPTLAQLAATGYRAEVAPGEKWVYSNPGFTLLGHLVTELEGRPFAQLVQERIFDPCAMTASTFDPAAAPTLATPHKRRRGRFEPVRPFAVSTISAGGVISTVADLARYATMLLAGGVGRHGRVVGEELLAEVFRTQFQPHPALKGIGLAFRLRRLQGETVVGHNGSVPGWNASLVLCPARGLAVVALTNRAVGPSAEFGAGRITSAVLDVMLAADGREGEDGGRRPGPGGDAPRDGDAGDGAAVAADDDPPIVAAPVASDADRRPEQSAPRPRWPVNPVALVGTYRPRPGALTNVRAYALFGGEVEVRLSAGSGLALHGLAGPLGGRHRLEPDDGDPLVLHLHHRGVDLPLAFDRAAGRSGALWLDGIPTGFRLHRVAPWRTLRVRRAAAMAALVVAVVARGGTARRARRSRERAVASARPPPFGDTGSLGAGGVPW